MKTTKKDPNVDKGLLLLGCIIYLVFFILWISGKADNTSAFFGGISALLTILNSYEVKQNSIKE